MKIGLQERFRGSKMDGIRRRAAVMSVQAYDWRAAVMSVQAYDSVE